MKVAGRMANCLRSGYTRSPQRHFKALKIFTRPSKGWVGAERRRTEGGGGELGDSQECEKSESGQALRERAREAIATEIPGRRERGRGRGREGAR